MRKLFLGIWLVLLSCGVPVKERVERGFISLFNGKDLTGWQVDEDSPPCFRVVDGCLVTGGGDGGLGLLCTEAEYGNYIFRFEWMLSDVGNSGILIRSDADVNLAWAKGFEVQLLAPWTPYRDDLHCTASIYGHVAVTNRPDETTGRWHKMEIICDRKDIIIAVDGELCTWADMDRVASLNEKLLRGRIGLQCNHSGTDQWVKFRNLRIRDLDREPEYVIKGFSYTDPRIRRLTNEAAVLLNALMVEPLCELMTEEDSISASGAKKALFDIAAIASAPDASEQLRSSVAKALDDQAGKSKSETVRSYVVWLLGLIGG